VANLGVLSTSLQRRAQWERRGGRVHSWRPNGSNSKFVQQNHSVFGQSGFFVITPNYRGSTGHGKEFEDANRFDMGGGDLEDVISAAEWIKKTGFIDPKKVAVAGGSYGGYLTMMAVTKAPDLWAAGVPIVPFVKLVHRGRKRRPLLREYDLATMGDPMKTRLAIRTVADQLRRPDQSAAAALGGGMNPRCPHTEAEQVASR